MGDVAGYGSSGSGGGSEGCGAYLDGLLEGHESRIHQLLYKFWMFCYLTFCLFGVVSSFHEMPVNAAVKGMTWALNDFASRKI